MSAHQEREAFEAWVRADTTLHLDRDMRGYADMTTELLWHAWQAARAAMAPAGEPIDRAEVLRLADEMARKAWASASSFDRRMQDEARKYEEDEKASRAALVRLLGVE